MKTTDCYLNSLLTYLLLSLMKKNIFLITLSQGWCQVRTRVRSRRRHHDRNRLRRRGLQQAGQLLRLVLGLELLLAVDVVDLHVDRVQGRHVREHVLRRSHRHWRAGGLELKKKDLFLINCPINLDPFWLKVGTLTSRKYFM